MITELVSWDGEAFAPDYEAGFVTGSEPRLPAVSVEMARRMQRWPLVGAVRREAQRLMIVVRIVGSDRHALRAQLFRWFDPDDETPKVLVGETHAGVQVYVEAICEELRVFGDQQHDTGFVLTLAVHDDVRWRAVTPDQVVWEITASGETQAVVNGGEDEAYPVLTIEPTLAKVGGYSYRRFVAVRWRASVGYVPGNYPVDIVAAGLDTAALVLAGKMQADGDDLRVEVDGTEGNRWLDAMDSAATKVWVNLGWAAKWDGTLAAAIAGTGTVDTIDVNESITAAPASGILIVETGATWEAFTYTGKNNSLQRFTGISRAAKGTVEAAHLAGDVIWWCQHEIYILYGNTSATAPTPNNDYAPAFELDHSTNTSWVYEEFGEDDGLRSAAWGGMPNYPLALYGGNHAAAADPWEELGQGGTTGLQPASTYRHLFNPCQITAANFTNGEKYLSDTAKAWDARIQAYVSGSYVDEYAIPIPSVAATWEAWSRNETLTAGATYVRLYMVVAGYGVTAYLETADCTLTLNSSMTPAVHVGDEDGAYSLDCTIVNETSDESIELAYTMAVNEELEVDTAQKTVTDLGDGSNQFQALTLVGGARRDWLALQPGTSTLRFDDVGTAGVTVTLEWEERFY